MECLQLTTLVVLSCGSEPGWRHCENRHKLNVHKHFSAQTMNNFDDTFEDDIEKIRPKAEVALDLELAVLYLQRKHSIKKKFDDIGALLDFLKYHDNGYELLDEICKDQSKSKIMQSIRRVTETKSETPIKKEFTDAPKLLDNNGEKRKRDDDNSRNNDNGSSKEPKQAPKSNRLEDVLNSTERWKKLCAKLDSANYWQRLADPFNIHPDEITRLRETFSKDPKFSPSEDMLRQWINQEDPTVDQFVEILDSIRHATARNMIKEWSK